MAKPRLLLVQTGAVAEPLRSAHGDYTDWFVRSFGEAASLTVLRAHEGARLPAAIDAAGVVVTGSPLSAVAGAREAWMDELGAALLEAGERGTPVLGVCFGHQIIARAAGGDVVKNPRGREIGTVQVQLTEAGRRDPLFAWAGAAQIDVQATHSDAVDPLPPGATLLASNENTPAQAARYSDAVATVQFHPELEPEALRALIRSRAVAIHGEGQDPDALIAGVRPTASARILHAFAEQCRRA